MLEFRKTFTWVNWSISVLILVLSVATVPLVLYKLLVSGYRNPMEARHIGIGKRFNGLPEINFAKSRQTILIALETTCWHCRNSLPFYRKLIAARNSVDPGTRIIALFDNDRHVAHDYVRENELDVEVIAASGLTMMSFDMTPTIVLVGPERNIIGSYEGFLEEESEQNVLKSVAERR